jgi:hypothetical protein
MGNTGHTGKNERNCMFFPVVPMVEYPFGF